MFDFEQFVYIVDEETGKRDVVAMATIEELPATISALSSELGITNIALGGDITSYNALIKDDIVKYTKLNYTNNKIEVEVLE